jgi:hypothetical protein
LRLASVVLAAVVLASSARAQNVLNGSHDAMIAQHAAANGLPEALVRRVIKIESGGNPTLVSKGNYGLMQIRLGTAKAMGYTGTPEGLLDANTNMTYAVKYLGGAYRAANGSHEGAIRNYQRGYYVSAKAKGFSPYERPPTLPLTPTLAAADSSPQPSPPSRKREKRAAPAPEAPTVAIAPGSEPQSVPQPAPQAVAATQAISPYSIMVEPQPAAAPSRKHERRAAPPAETTAAIAPAVEPKRAPSPQDAAMQIGSPSIMVDERQPAATPARKGDRLAAPRLQVATAGVPDALPTPRPVPTTAYAPEPSAETSPAAKRERRTARQPQVAVAPVPEAKPAAQPQAVSAPAAQPEARTAQPSAPKPAQVAKKKQDSGWSLNPLPYLVRNGARPNEPARPSR